MDGEGSDGCTVQAGGSTQGNGLNERAGEEKEKDEGEKAEEEEVSIDSRKR